MSTHDRPRPSRRAVLAGAGGVAGAVALGAVPAAAEPAPTATPGHPMPGAPLHALPPLATTPGLRYVTLNDYAFHTDPWVGKLTTATGAYTENFDGLLTAPLVLESGCIVTELTASITNYSGANAALNLERVFFAGGGDVIAGPVVPSGGTSPQVVTKTGLSVTITGDTTYDLYIQTNKLGTTRILAASVGFVPYGYRFRPIPATRVYDSRAGNPPNNVTKGKLGNSSTRAIDMFNGLSVPTGIQGVLTNLAVVNTSPSGFLALFKWGESWNGTSSINWFTTSEIVANTGYTGVDASGRAVAYVPANASTDFFIDVVGYFW